MTRERRAALNDHGSVVLWMTGLSGSGKSTICHEVEERLYQRGYRSYVFDGDNVRHGLCSDLGFSEKERNENIRRIGEMVKLFLDAGIIVLTAFISPYREQRLWVRDLVGAENFIEVYCKCPIAVCEQRDVKGLYRKARLGEIREFTGISAPYEEPEGPELVLDTVNPLEDCVQKVIQLIEARGGIPENGKRV